MSKKEVISVFINDVEYRALHYKNGEFSDWFSESGNPGDPEECIRLYNSALMARAELSLKQMLWGNNLSKEYIKYVLRTDAKLSSTRWQELKAFSLRYLREFYNKPVIVTHPDLDVSKSGLYKDGILYKTDLNNLKSVIKDLDECIKRDRVFIAISKDNIIHGYGPTSKKANKNKPYYVRRRDIEIIRCSIKETLSKGFKFEKCDSIKCGSGSYYKDGNYYIKVSRD